MGGIENEALRRRHNRADAARLVFTTARIRRIERKIVAKNNEPPWLPAQQRHKAMQTLDVLAMNLDKFERLETGGTGKARIDRCVYGLDERRFAHCSAVDSFFLQAKNSENLVLTGRVRTFWTAVAFVDW